MRTLIAALAVASVLAGGAARAEDLVPSHARSIDLNGVTGVAYYTVEKGEFAVVAVLAAGEDSRPVRFEARLWPNQSVTLSVPGAEGERDTSVAIVRRGNDVSIAPTVVALN